MLAHFIFAFRKNLLSYSKTLIVIIPASLFNVFVIILGALDEEGLIINESNFLNAVDASNLQHYHKLFYWGDIHRIYLLSHRHS